MKLTPALLLSALVLAGCSSSSSDAPASGGSGGAAGAGGGAGAGGQADAGSDGPSAFCIERDAMLQSVLDTARGKAGSRDAAFAITTPECGAHVYVSGESGIHAEDLFRIGSVTKTYVASLVLKLVEDGKLSLDDTAAQHVTGVPNGSTITLRMLLQHTSGLYNYTNDAGFQGQLTKSWTPEELVQISATHGPDFAPGAKWAYSNTNYIVLGLIAEKVGGEGIAVQIRSRLLAPNQLDQTFLDGEETLTGTLAPGFGANGSDATHAIDPSAAWAAGAMVATPRDEGRWVELLGSGTILGAQAQAEMETGTSIGAGTSYGLGVFLLDPSITIGAGRGIGHGGDINGYHTQAFYFPDSKVAVASIVNQDGANPNDLTAAALEALFQ